MRLEPGLSWRRCLSRTREDFLREICDILSSPDADTPRVCLLTGVAGAGKFPVAVPRANAVEVIVLLRRNPNNMFITIARDLSDHNPQCKSALWQCVSMIGGSDMLLHSGIRQKHPRPLS